MENIYLFTEILLSFILFAVYFQIWEKLAETDSESVRRCLTLKPYTRKNSLGHILEQNWHERENACVTDKINLYTN